MSNMKHADLRKTTFNNINVKHCIPRSFVHFLELPGQGGTGLNVVVVGLHFGN